MSAIEDYLTSYRVFFENFAATVNPEDQLPVNIAGYTITEAELPGEVLYWITQYLTEKQCPPTLMTPLQRIILDEVRTASKKHPNEFGYKSDDAVYIALRLMQAVTARVNDVCLRYLDNSRLDSLPPPPPLAQRDMKTVSCATKNSRRVMEDRHVEIGNLEAMFGIETTEPTSFYAVYDGHAGSAAAMYCAAHLHQYLVESPHFTTDLRRAMKDAFLRTDAEFVRKSNQERACGGSTAVAVAIRGRELLAAWAGDSLALLAKRMRLMQLVRPHKPGREDERERIEKAGGTVMFWGTWRVNGQLAVSRAIGDAQYKPYVTARPETATVALDGDEDFVVVACDGLWDFVSEDQVALAVYQQLAVDPDDLKAVTKRLVVQAKRQGSSDNISIIVVFLKDPRHIAADNYPPMDFGLDNALANAPPFAPEGDACKRLDTVHAVAVPEANCVEDNGVDNSDSDSEDLGPETAVDVDADDLDNETRNHDPAPPTPPAHTVETSHVDGGTVDNVAESGEESEDEWNYFKGEGEPQNDRPRSETPPQDNSACESSSVDMNSSPLNPDAPVFVPTGVADVVLAESPRKPLPMDDIELPDSAQFQSEAVVRPAELLDLDNCDQLNGHHNISMEGVKEQLNGNDKCMDSLGFGFNVGIDSGKIADTALIHDFDRIQKDTTDFCNIQVFQAHTETNPFATEGNEELFERLKNKNRDPMSMSFYQEKDDDTCEGRAAEECVDLNAVQTLPDSDDEELNGELGDHYELDKENQLPRSPRPDNDRAPCDPHPEPLLDFGQPHNFLDNAGAEARIFSDGFECSNVSQDVAQTDTPESHKLLFEQIPEIPDGKSSELGFANEDAQDPPSESDRDARAITPQDETSQDVEMESKCEDSPCEEFHPELRPESKEEQHIEEKNEVTEPIISLEPANDAAATDAGNEIVPECDIIESYENERTSSPVVELDKSAITPEIACDIRENFVVDVHQAQEAVALDDSGLSLEPHGDVPPASEQPPDTEAAQSPLPAESPLPVKSPLPAESPLLAKSPLPAESPLLAKSPLPAESPLLTKSPLPGESPLLAKSPLPAESRLPAESPLPPQESPTSQDQSVTAESPFPAQSPEPSASPLPTESPALATSPLPAESPVPDPTIVSPVLAEAAVASESPVPAMSPVEVEPAPDTAQPVASPLLMASPLPVEAAVPLEPEVAVPEQADPAERLASPCASPSPSGPAPDIVPEEPMRPELEPVPQESHAQEICVPVTSEIQPEEAAVATPPPTPAVEPGAPLSETAIAADVAASEPSTEKAAATVGVAAAVAAVGAVAVSATKQKASAKKPTMTPSRSTSAAKTTPVAKTTPASKTTPKPAPTTRSTPASLKKTTPTTTPARPTATKTMPARTPTGATKSTPTTATKPATPTAAPTAAPAKPAAARPAAPRPATAAARPAAQPRAALAAKEAPATAKSAPSVRAAAAARPAAKPATAAVRAASATAPPKPAAVRAPARPAPRSAPAAAAPKPKPIDKKPLTNGDAKPQPRPAAAKPAPRPATAPLRNGVSAPRPQPRATRPAADADKQSKDLANRRITAKTAPPRTAPNKTAAAPKGTTMKAVPKKPLNGVGAAAAVTANGAADGELVKPPPSPPAADNALLPDVIA